MGYVVFWITVTRFLLSECSICLTWQLHDNILKFRCQTTRINARISFFDQNNHEQAYCVLPYQSSFCISYNIHRKIYQNLTSKNTFFEISDQIGQHLNGQWSCQYGRNLEIGYVDVKIITQKVGKRKDEVLRRLVDEYEKNENIPFENTKYHKSCYKYFKIHQLSGKYIRITGASMVKTGGPLWLSCFSNIPLMVKQVKFYANNDLYITLIKDSYGCHTSADKECEPDQCHCSEDGNTYFIKHKGILMAGNVSLQCKMEFELGLEMSDCKFVEAIALDKPIIMHEHNQLWFSTDHIKTTCYAFVQRSIIKLEWDCFDITPFSTIRNGTIIRSTLSFQVRSYMNNKICTCKASFKKLESSSSFTVKVSKAPALALTNMVVCNQSTTICIVCNARSEQIVHFGSWIHLYNTHFIRLVNGSHNASSSTIRFDKCNFEDEGEYICQAHSIENGIDFQSNTSTKVDIKGLPYFVSTDIFDDPIFKVSVQIYSAPPPMNIDWFVAKNIIVKNSTRFEQSLESSLVQRKVHGKSISTTGYTATIQINNYSTAGMSSISISVQNEFGNVTKRIVFNKNKLMSKNLNHRTFIFVIFGIVILIVTIAVSSIIVKLRSGRQNAVGSVYFAAPPQESNVHTYDTSEQISQYEEIDAIQNAQLNENPLNLLEEADKDDKEKETKDDEEEYESEDGYQIPHDYLEVF